jgi:hypothetical protein
VPTFRKSRKVGQPDPCQFRRRAKVGQPHESVERRLVEPKDAEDTGALFGILRSFAVFIAHSAMATMGSLIGGVALGFLCSLFAALWSSGAGNIVDRAADSWFFRHLVDNPYFLVPVFVSFCVGFFVFRFSRHSSGAWAWLLPFAILLLNIVPSLFRSSTHDVVQSYFGRGCGSDECLDQLFFTAPFYTSVAYSLGWLSRRWAAELFPKWT